MPTKRSIGFNYNIAEQLKKIANKPQEPKNNRPLPKRNPRYMTGHKPG